MRWSMGGALVVVGSVTHYPRRAVTLRTGRRSAVTSFVRPGNGGGPGNCNGITTVQKSLTVKANSRKM